MIVRKRKRLPPIHPGEVLQDILSEAGLTVNALALALRVPANRIGGVVKGQRGITADTALRLGRYFGTSAQMWMNLQAKYELAVAEDLHGERIQNEVLRHRAAQARTFPWASLSMAKGSPFCGRADGTECAGESVYLADFKEFPCLTRQTREA